ncbi:MAG: hypothetical protein LBD53_05865 [Tannerella sp.]|jgi:hypothetical protein|nr:hypothetical protein [Tannerella sp.]
MTQMMNKQAPSSPVVSTSLEKLISQPVQNSNERLETHNIKDNNDFSLQDLQQCIQKYAEQLTIERIHLKNTLLDGIVTLNGDRSFEIAVYNPSQQNELQINSNEIISVLRNKLKNSMIKINVRLVEKEEHEMIYTSTEKLHYLNSKNPNIEKLMEMFNLSLE